MQKKTTPYQICQIAIHLFEEFGFEETSMVDIAERASITEAELYSCFGHKNDVVLFLFQSINSDWQSLVDNIPSRKIADRFEECLRIKVRLMEPYVDFLSQIMGLLIQNAKVGVKAPRTSHIRTIGLQTMQTIIDESTNGKRLKKRIAHLPSIMYFMHWTVLFTRLQTNNQENVDDLIKLLARTLKHPKKLGMVKMLFPFLKELSNISEKLFDVSDRAIDSIDKEILKVIFNNRKAIDLEVECKSNQCNTCFSLHEPAVNFFTSQSKPIHFILPAFPAKSPNPLKTIGKVPDLGEEIALKTLESMCQEIGSIYKPGAQITICSDGRIFSELVGVSDYDVSEYVAGIAEMIERHGIKHIDIINLEDIGSGNNFDEMRTNLINDYAEDLESLRSNVKHKPEMQGFFNGIHRFITEDRLAIEKDKSKTRIKQESKLIALKVIQHSNAWTRLLGRVYPEAIRLSIHPYPVHSRKIGIQLTKAEDNWLTPWHGAIALQENGYMLMKRSKAEEMGALLVHNEGQPYYYSLIKDQWITR
jgi:pyoverdine/dityrosine biosynthesis protein Dit1/AcrR family transcriptional regulator